MSSSGRYSHLSSHIRIESKIFSIEFDELYAGSVIKFGERSRHGSFELKLGLDCAHWLGKCLLEAVQHKDDRKFFCTRRFNMHRLWINRFENNRGAFLQVSLIVGKSGLKSIVIPMGSKASGWSECARLILSIFPSGGNVGSGAKEKIGKVGHMKNDASVRKGGEGGSGGRNSAKIKKGVSFAECLVYGEWIRAVVCSKQDGSVGWGYIQKALSSFLGIRIELKPFHDDKAVFFCQDEREAAKVGKIGICRLEGSVYVSLQQWRPEINSVNERMAFGGGWLAIEGLPFHLWNRNSFCKIADFCGGLIQVDKQTELFLSLREARIKVGKTNNSFIPTLIQFKDGDRLLDIGVRPLSKFGSPSSRSFILHHRRKVEDELGKGKGPRGSRWEMVNSNIQIGSTCRKQAKLMWRVKRDNRNREVAGEQAEKADFCREGSGLLRKLSHEKGADLIANSVKKICGVGRDYRKFDQNGSDGEKEPEPALNGFQLKESSRSGMEGLSGLSLKSDWAHVKEVGSGYQSDPGPRMMNGMNGPSGCLGALKAHDGLSKGFSVSGPLKDNRPNQGPSVSDGGGKIKIGPFNPKSPSRFIFVNSFPVTSFDQTKQTDSADVSVLKPADSDDEDQKSEEDDNLGSDGKIEGEKKATPHSIGKCCWQNCLRYKVEAEISGQGMESENLLETADISRAAAEWDDQNVAERVLSDSDSDISQSAEAEISKTETVKGDSLDLHVLFDELREVAVDVDKPKVCDKREKDGCIIQYRRKKKLVNSFSPVSKEAPESSISGESERFKTLLKKMNLSLYQRSRTVQETTDSEMNRKKKSSREMQVLRRGFSSEKGKDSGNKGPNVLS